MKKIRLNAKRGILFWVTGLSGSGKSSIAEKIWPRIKKKFGPTLLVNGDNMRQIFNLKKYDRKSRLENAINFSKFSEYVTNQGINIIFANIGMFHKARNRNRVKIENYIDGNELTAILEEELGCDVSDDDFDWWEEYKDTGLVPQECIDEMVYEFFDTGELKWVS